VYHRRLGRALKHNGKINDTIKEYVEAIRIEPNIGYYHVLLANLFYDQGLVDDALDEYEKALKMPLDEACKSYAENAVKTLKKKGISQRIAPSIYPTWEDDEVWRWNRNTDLALRNFVRNKLVEKYNDGWIKELLANDDIKKILDVHKTASGKDTTYNTAFNQMGIRELFRVITSYWYDLFNPVFGEDKKYWNNRAHVLSEIRNKYAHNDTDQLKEYEKIIAIGYYQEILDKIGIHD
jgi:tetratricopeptide (TPR) repeat protein